ncbi:MAG: YihY/virulence factor BrkB family protein [Polyangiaceae bacterium]
MAFVGAGKGDARIGLATARRMRALGLVSLLKRTTSEWIEDNAPSRAASLSYYTVFSLAPLLLIAVAIAGFVFGHDAVSGELGRQLQGLLGTASANAIQDMMARAHQKGTGILASVAGGAILLIGSTGAFVELQDALNAMWDVDKKKTSGVWALVRARLLSFAMIGVIAFLLLASLVVSAVLAALGRFAEHTLPGGEVVAHGVNFVVSLAVISVLFAAIFKVLPDVRIGWSDVWLGAGATALFFVAGKLLIGLYIGKSSLASGYGAAGSFAVLLIWVYYSAMIVLFGAEFTQVHARSRTGFGPSAPTRTDTPEPRWRGSSPARGAGAHCALRWPRPTGFRRYARRR